VETSLLGRLPAVSARSTALLAGLGLVCLLLGLVAGATLLAPAGLAGVTGLISGLYRAVQVWAGRAYPREGKITLLAATVVNAGMVLFVAVAAYIILRFGN
jgi:hypothetical protein